MKTRFFAFLAVVAGVLAGCEEKEPLTTAPISTGETVVDRVNGFETIEIPVNGTWQVTYSPEWAGPLNPSGKAGEPLEIFVETNDDGAERSDTIWVLAGNGQRICLPLRQHGADTDEGGYYITEKDLKVTYGAGYSTNVFENPTGMKYQVKASSPLKFDKLYAALRSAGEADALYGDSLYSSRTESYTGTTSDDISHELGVKAGIEVGISAFKLSVEGSFSQKSSSTGQRVYAIEEIQHIVGERYLRAGMLREMAGGADTIFQPTFRTLRAKLAKNPGDVDAMKHIVERYGTHLIVRGTLGGELKLGMELTTSQNISEGDIHAALELGVKVVNLNGEANLSSKEKAIAENTKISLTSYGGNNVYTIAPGTTFDTFQTTVKSYSNLDSWTASIKDGSSLALIDIETMPIYDLMPTEESRTALRNYIVGDYQTRFYREIKGDESYQGPNMYCITGYYSDATYPLSKSMALPGLGMTVKGWRDIIPALSETEYSTIIFSGEGSKADETKGFFVGSKTRKPAKVKFDKNGKVTHVEEFSLLPAGVIEKIYVDQSKELRLVSQGVPDLYEDVNLDLTLKRIELISNATDVRVTENCVISGKTRSKLRVWASEAEKITVIFDGVEITDHKLDVRGNVEIVLNNGSDNNVGMIEYYSTVNDTLHIHGHGKLTTLFQNAYGIDMQPCSNAKPGSLILGADEVYLSGPVGNIRYGGKHIIFESGNITIRGDYYHRQDVPALGTPRNALWNWDWFDLIAIKGTVDKVTIYTTKDNPWGAINGWRALDIEDRSKVIYK